VGAAVGDVSVSGDVVADATASCDEVEALAAAWVVLSYWVRSSLSDL
jgi:hypothetical protein